MSHPSPSSGGERGAWFCSARCSFRTVLLWAGLHSFTSIKIHFLDLATPNLPRPAPAVPFCCRAGVASLSHSLIVPFIDVGVRAGSENDFQAAPGSVAAPLPHNQQKGTEMNSSAWDAPVEPGAGPTRRSQLGVLVIAHFQHISVPQVLPPCSCLIWRPRDL